MLSQPCASPLPPPPPPHRGPKLSLIARLPLDSVAKSVFPSLHMQDPLAKSGFPSLHMQEVPSRLSGFLHTNQLSSHCLPPYL